MKKQTKIIIALAAVLVVLVAAALVLPAMFTADVQEGEKSFTFTVIYEGKETDFEITTDKDYLADALIDEGLLDTAEKESGMYTVIDGVKADYNVDGAWWCVTKGGEMTTVGMNDLVIEDGDSFEATYTKN